MSSYSQASILVADSNAETLFSIAAILIAQDYQVQIAGCASHAIDLAREKSLDLLIADTRLSDSTGIELIETIRQLDDHADLPVVFVTANQSPDVIRRSHEMGAAYHLKKPLDAALLCEIVDKAMWVPHLVKSHVDQKTIQAPHISFAKNPMNSPFAVTSFLDGTPITF